MQQELDLFYLPSSDDVMIFKFFIVFCPSSSGSLNDTGLPGCFSCRVEHNFQVIFLIVGIGCVVRNITNLSAIVLLTLLVTSSILSSKFSYSGSSSMGTG